jgi:hypothetical protein
LMFVAVSSFGQSGQATMSPTTVDAGKNITVTITVNKVPSVQQTTLHVGFAPKDPKDNATAFGFNLGQKENDSKVYTGGGLVPPNAKGIWSVQEVTLGIPSGGGNVTLDTNHPEFTVTPVVVTLPTKGDVVVTP